VVCVAADVGQSEELDGLEAKAREISNVVLIVIDPMNAYLGKPGKIEKVVR
jgi:argininosuccinate synthase